MADTIIDKVQVQIEATTKGTAQAFAMLDRQLSRLQNALNAVDTSKLQIAQQATKSISLLDARGFTKEEREVKKAVDNIKQSFASLKAYKEAALGGDASSLTSFSRKAIHLQSDIDGLQERLRQVEDMMKNGNLDTAMFQTYREQLAEVVRGFEAAKGQVTDAVQAMNDSKITLDAEESKSNLDILKEKARSAANTIASTIGRGAINAFKNLASNIKKAASHMKDLGHSTNGATGNFRRGFMTVLKYGFGIRSLYVLFRRLRKAVVESFGELQKSGAFYETTRANIEALKASLTTLKYQFGAAFEPIFNAIAPALQTLINYLVTAANAISAFMAKLTGKSTYSKAVASANDLADATGGAAKAQKELNKQLQGFDELNNLSSNNPSGGGGGGGASGDSSAVQYVEESVENALGDFGKQLAEAIRKGDWGAVGEMIGEKLTEQLNGIKWDTLKGKAEKFGTDLGNFINGLISPELFGAIGTTIGEAINTVLTGTNALGNTIKWKNVGDSIASGINAFVKTNPLALVVENFNTWANGILDALNSAIEGISWKTIGDHIATAIGKVDAWNIGWKLGKLVDNLVDAVYTLASNKDTWKNIGKKIADGINGFFKGFDGSDLAAAANAIANGLWTALGTALKNLSWKSIGEDIVGFIGNLDIGTISLIAAVALTPAALTAIKSGITTILTTTVASLGGVSVGTIAVSVVAALAIGWKIGNKIYEKATGEEVQGGMAEQLKEVINGLFGEDKIDFDLGEFIEFTFGEDNPWNNFWGDAGEGAYQLVEDLKKAGKDIVTGLKDGIVDGLTGIATWVDEKFKAITDAVKKFFGINSPSTVFKGYGGDIIQGLKDGLTNALSGIATWLKTNVVDKILDGVAAIKEITTTIKGKIDDTFNKAKTAWDSITNKTTELITEAKEKAGYLISTIKDKWTTGWETTKELITEAKEKADGLISTIKDKWDNWKDTIKSLFTKTEQEKGYEISVVQNAWTSFVNNPGVAQLVAKAPSYEDIQDSVTKLKDKVTKGLSTTIQTKLKKPKEKNRKSVAKAIKKFISGDDSDAGFNKTVGLKIDVSSTIGNLKTWVNNHIIKPLNDTLAELGKKAKIIITPITPVAAKGGAYYGGSWHNIPQYASGTVDALKHGSVFVAGENGPEVAGHINGRTEILNRSQLASTMHSAIISGMSQFKNAQMVSPPTLAYANGMASVSATSNQTTNNDLLMAEQNQLIAEQNRLLQIIANKNVTISSREVFNATRQEAQNYNNRTGNSPFLF